jgi:hypothetical protein
VDFIADLKPILEQTGDVKVGKQRVSSGAPPTNGPLTGIRFRELTSTRTGTGKMRTVVPAWHQLQEGDIVVFYKSDPNLPDHSAIVISKQGPYLSENEVRLRSKDVNNSLFEHRLGTGADDNYFRKTYCGESGGLRFFRMI